MSPAEVIDVFRDAGAILDGHFILSSGLRSPVFIQKARVFMYPERTERLCRRHRLFRNGRSLRKAAFDPRQRKRRGQQDHA